MNEHAIPLDSDTNKRILWDILKDNNVFDNMRNNQYIEVKNVFDSVVSFTSKHIEKTSAYYSITEKNKLIIEQLIPAIENIRSATQNASTNRSSPSMEVIYDANIKRSYNKQQFHMKKSEQSQYNMEQYEMQKRERELSLDPKIPSEIDFSDKAMENDSPIGDDMDRLIAERLASREHELSVFNPPKESKEEKKVVSFSPEIELHDSTILDYDGQTETIDNNPTDYVNENGNVINDSSTNLLNSRLKLKRKTQTASFSITEEQYNDLMERIKKLELQIHKDQSVNSTSILPPS